jgi:hypothetical protein
MSALRDTVAAALARCTSCCLDVDEERAAVAEEVVDALLARPEAQLVRAVFANAPTGGTRLIVMREIGGRREAEVLDAAARLAGLDGVA